MEELKLKSRKKVLEKFFDVEELCFTVSGTDEEIVRLRVVPKKACAILVHNTEKDTLIFCRQYRTALEGMYDDARVLEIPAGVMDKGDGEDATDCARREALEETGYRVNDPVFIGDIYASPGYTSERIHLYYGAVTSEDKVKSGGGVDGEHENIQVVELPFSRTLEMIKSGEILDAKTLVTVQWLALGGMSK